MSAAADWLEQLEARLEQVLESFLRANPAQEALLKEQQRLDLRQRQRQLLLQAESLRSELLHIAEEIRQWRDRSQRARNASANDLAARADRQVVRLMEQGRQRWQALEQLGQEVRNSATAAGSQGTATPNATSATAAGSEPLDQTWARFETEQELQALRRRQDR